MRYDAVLAAVPDHPEAARLRARLIAQMAATHYDRGTALAGIGRTEDAWECFARAIALRPDDANAQYDGAVALAKLGRFAAARAGAEAALAARSGFVEALILLGNILMRLGKPRAALARYAAAIEADPDQVDAHNNHASALRELGRDRAAIAGYGRAIARQPDFAAAQWNRAVAHLLLGDFGAGWPAYEWRHRLDGGERPAGPARRQWRGQRSLAGRAILVSAEQGFGDSLQFCRYLPLLQDHGARVIFAVQPPLRALMARYLPGIAVIAGETAPPKVDVYCPLLSLPLAFSTTLASIPPIPAHLEAEPQRTACWATRLGPRQRKRIGIAWSGNPSHINDHNRSIPLDQWRDLLTGDADWVAVQKDLRPTDASALKAFGVRHFGDALADFEDTAAVIAGLDLVIAVDTSAAHLAALMGKPVWLLLAATPDWRWLRQRRDSPWYASIRLFRQTRRGDWRALLAEVSVALQAFRG